MVRMNWNIRQQAQATLTVQQKQDNPILNQKQKEQADSNKQVEFYKTKQLSNYKTIEYPITLHKTENIPSTTE